MVSLYCGLNLLFNVVKRPSIVLHISCLVCVNDSRNCRPFLPSQFLWLLSVLLVACYIIWRYSLPLVWSFLAHFTWSSASQLNVGCFITVCLVWVPHYVFFLLQPEPCPVLLFLLLQPLPALLPLWYLSVHLHYMYMYSLLMSAYMRLLLQTPCITRWCLYAYLLRLHESKSEFVFTCVHAYIYTDCALHQTIYMMLIGYASYMMWSVLVMSSYVCPVY